MKNIVAMAKAGTLPRGSKLDIYFGSEKYAAMAPLIPEALELYLTLNTSTYHFRRRGPNG